MQTFTQLKKNLKKDFTGLKAIKVAVLGDTATQFLIQALAVFLLVKAIPAISKDHANFLQAASIIRAEVPGTKFMIVGGAAILTGIVVGGEGGHVISIVGAVVGLYGLYKYLQ